MARRLLVGLIGAFDVYAVALRPCRVRYDLLDFRDYLRTIAGPVAVGVDRDPPPTIFAEDLIGSVGLLDARDQPQRHLPGGRRDQEIAQAGSRAIRVRQTDHH